MAPKQLTPALSDLAARRRRIDHWRSTREQFSPMPEELWREAVSLAARYGLGRVARSLGVDYGTLKSRYNQASRTEAEPSSSGAAEFVELALPRLPKSAEAPVTVELAAPDGSKLTVHLSGSAGPTVLDLVDAFWRRGA